MKLDTISRIIRLGRLRFPVSGFLLYSFGALLAARTGAKFALDRFLLGYTVLFTANLSVSYSNDYFDIEVDRHIRPTAISGGSGILIKYPELRELSKRAAIFLIVLSVVLSAILALWFRFPVHFLPFVFLGNLLAWYYSAPPLRLAYRGLSEITVLIAVGLMSPGMGYFILKGGWDTAFLTVSLASVIYSLAYIISVETPDMEGDKLGRKETIIVRRGRKFGFEMIALSFLVGTLYLFLLSMMTLSLPSVDLRRMVLFSLLPLTSGAYGFVKQPQDKEAATRLVSYDIATILLFLFMVDIYFITTQT